MYEARWLFGADSVLLIAAILDDGPLRRFLDISECIGMISLVEVANATEMETAIRKLVHRYVYKI